MCNFKPNNYYDTTTALCQVPQDVKETPRVFDFLFKASCATEISRWISINKSYFLLPLHVPSLTLTLLAATFVVYR